MSREMRRSGNRLLYADDCHRAANGDQGVTTAAVQPATGAAAPTGHAACNSAGDGLLRQVGCPKPLALTGCPPTVAMS